MGMSFGKIKATNLLLGLICFFLALWTYLRTASSMLTNVDTAGLILTCLVIAESILGAITCYRMGDSCCYTCYKCLCCFVLAIEGAALLLEALTFWQEEHPSCFAHPSIRRSLQKECQYLELRIVQGILFLFNGVLYLFANPAPSGPRFVGANGLIRPGGIMLNSGFQGNPATPARGGRTTVITANASGSTSIINIHNNSVRQPLIRSSVAVPPRPAPFPATVPAQPQSQAFTQRPLPPEPNAQAIRGTTSASAALFEPSAPPPAYYDCPPPYSTLPPNTHLPKGSGH